MPSEQEPKPLKVDIRKLFTKSAYAKAYSTNRPKIDQQIKDGVITLIPIHGGELILAD